MSIPPPLAWRYDEEITLRGEPPVQPDGERWEVEIGYGKGRYLLRRAQSEPMHRFLGIEVVSRYFRLARDRARRRALKNLTLVRGEALFVAAALLPRRFVDVVHAYFPDPWHKSRHHRRRFLDAQSLDLVLGLLKPGGSLVFASDSLEFADAVEADLRAHPCLAVERREELWDDGPRTNYEAKFVREGREIRRLVCRLHTVPEGPATPQTRRELVAAWRDPEPELTTSDC